MKLIVIIASLFGFAMMVAQFRFHYFGYIFLLIIPLLIIQHLLPRGKDIFIASAIIIGAYTFSLSYALIPPKLGESPRYNFGLPIIQAAKLQCEKQPGLLLVDRNWGSFIRYQTQCPILSNNFILTPKEVDYVNLTSKLLKLTPAELRVSAPEIRYIIVSEMDLNPLSVLLLSNERFDGFEVLGELHDKMGKLTGRFYQVDR